MLDKMQPIDCLNIIVLIPFVILMCIFTTLVTRKRKAYTSKSLKGKPNFGYLKARIRSNSALNQHFPSIKSLTLQLLGLERFVTRNSLDPDNDICGAENRNAISTRGSYETDSVPSVMEKIAGTEFVLLEKLNNLYLSLVQNASNKEDMQNAIRFEIKQRCMTHPHDIFGAAVCKKIGSLYQDVIDQQQKQTKDSSFGQWYTRIDSACYHLSTTCFAKFKKRCLDNKNIFLKVLIVSLITIVTLGGVFAVSMLVNVNIWMEVGLLICLLGMTIGSVFILKQRDFYSNFTSTSIIVAVGKVVFLVVGLHLYDYVADIQVLYIFVNPKVLRMSFTLISRMNDKNYPSIFNYNKYVSNPGNVSQRVAPKELMYPIIGISAIFLMMTLIMSMIFTIPSITTIITKIRLYLLFDGEPVSVRTATANTPEYNKIQHVSTESIIYRNELSINEASYESSYQFLGQWVTYFVLCYWISVVTKINNKLGIADDYDTSNILLNSTTQNGENMDKHIAEIKEISTFQILWKSGVLSLASMSFCQLKTNNVLHEYSTDLRQKFFYLIASVGNTTSFTSIAVLGSVAVVDITILLSNKINHFVVLCFICAAINIPLMIKGMLWIVKRSLYDFDLLDLHRKNIDRVPSKASFKNLLAFSTGPDKGILPTSSIDLYFKEKHYTSYQSTSSTELLNALINHWIYYIFCCIMICILSGFRLYLMFGKIGNPIFDDKIDFSYGETSPARYNFEAICCVVIPLGWLLENIFLYLYFKYDQGYFHGVNLHFHYKNDVRFDNPNLKVLTTKCKNFCAKCVSVECLNLHSHTSIGEDFTRKLKKVGEIGEWVDLSGQEKYNIYKNTLDSSQIVCDDTEIHSFFNLNEAETVIFDDIKRSFPYYRNYDVK